MNFIQPLDDWYITSNYGWRIHPIYHDRRFHNGLDLRAPEGTPVYSIAEGIVRTYTSGKGGKTMAVVHDNNFESKFAHLSKFIANTGDHVNAGDLIALTGNTGSSTTAPHLHYSLYENGSHVNPVDYNYIDKKDAPTSVLSMLTGSRLIVSLAIGLGLLLILKKDKKT